MTPDQVSVSFQGVNFRVDREKLEANQASYRRIAAFHGMTPEQQTGDLFPPNNALSFEQMAIAVTIFYDGGEPLE
jgi:hypothetical protein